MNIGSQIYSIGLDIHKKIIAFCIKQPDGGIVREGKIEATRDALKTWLAELPQPFQAAMEATIFTGWIYDFIDQRLPPGCTVKVGHPAMMKAVVAAKNKNDKLDARLIADLLRCDLLPEVYMAPTEMRDLRRVLRFRNYTVRLSVSLKNKNAGLLMECGQQYQKKKLHQKKYFSELLENLQEVPESVKDLLRYDHEMLRLFTTAQRRLIATLRSDSLLAARVERLMTIPGVGEITALTWALEIGDPDRFSNSRKARSYCGLCSAQKESAGKMRRMPLSKKRNKHLQRVLIEAAKLAPLFNPQLKIIYEKELKKGNRNQATLAVARKQVDYLMAVDKSDTAFELRAA